MTVADTTSSEHTGCATHDGLRHALNVIKLRGWESDTGRDVIAAVRQRSGSWAALVDRRCGLPTGTMDPGDVVTTAWFTLSRFADNIARANAPWAYLWISVSNSLAVDNADDAYLSRASNARDKWSTPVRAGLDDQVFAGGTTPEVVRDLDVDTADLRCSWSPALYAMLRLFTEAGGNEGFWADAIDRAVDVMASSKRSYEVVNLRHDPYMLHVLGLTPAELSALAGLLIGPSRADRGVGSLLLALHRDLASSLDDVAGARGRVALLLSRCHARQGAYMAAA